MAVKKLKLSPDGFPDIGLIGIHTDLSDHRLAYFINKETILQLERLDDLPVFNERAKVIRDYCLYHWADVDRRMDFYLIKNSHQEGKMIEQYAQANYFLLIKGVLNGEVTKPLQGILRKIISVTFVFVPDINKIKELDGILQDLEIHVISQSTRLKQVK